MQRDFAPHKHWVAELHLLWWELGGQNHMKKLIASATVLACMLMGGAAFAKDHDRDDHKGKGPQHRNVRWDRDHDRDHRPAGWDKGKKKGWGDCDLPPGQAKKHGCYDRDRHHHRARRVARKPPTTVHRSPRPVEGVWRQNKRTSSTTTTTTTPNTGTWRRPTTTQQTTTTTTTQPGPTASNGTWRK
jgi:hypothetical protein